MLTAWLGGTDATRVVAGRTLRLSEQRAEPLTRAFACHRSPNPSDAAVWTTNGNYGEKKAGEAEAHAQYDKEEQRGVSSHEKEAAEHRDRADTKES